MNKHLQKILILLIFISTASAAYLLSSKKDHTTSISSESTITLSQSSTPENVIPAHLENNPTSTPSDTNKKIKDKIPLPSKNIPADQLTSSPPLENSNKPISTTFIIDNAEYQLTVAPDTTAYDAMIQLQESSKISFSTKKFSSLGYFIEEINGIKNSPSTGFYWTLYINNEEAKVGASNYILKPNDIITWKYENK